MTKNIAQAESFLNDRLTRDFRTNASRVIPLGGEHYPSAGTTPEVVFPYAVEVDATNAQNSALHRVPLDELISSEQQIKDAHLLTSMYRLAHSVGLLK